MEAGAQAYAKRICRPYVKIGPWKVALDIIYLQPGIAAIILAVISSEEVLPTSKVSHISSTVHLFIEDDKFSVV